MPENKEYMTHQEELGTIQISEEVVASIASAAVQEVPDVTGLLSANVSDFMGGKKMTAKGVRVEMDGEAIVVYVLSWCATAAPSARWPRRRRMPCIRRWRAPPAIRYPP